MVFIFFKIRNFYILISSVEFLNFVNFVKMFERPNTKIDKLFSNEQFLITTHINFMENFLYISLCN